jgi:hypothetical protein
MNKIIATILGMIIFVIFTSIPCRAESCLGDLNFDGDCDGGDLSAFIADFNPGELADFASGFGRINCPARKVDSAGGIFEFPNGVILDIPEGAVDQETVIEITDISCEQVDELLSARVYASHKKRCLGGFLAEPDGLVFNIPITATLPVQPVDAGEIPIQLEINHSDQSYRNPPTDLIYDGDQLRAEIKINGFSDQVVTTIKLNPGDKEDREFWEKWAEEGNLADERCRTCSAYLNNITFCTDFNKPQDPCCYIPRKLREACALQCNCCKEKKAIIRAEGIDFSSASGELECSILGDKVMVNFPECDGAPTESYSINEISDDCPEGLTYQIKVDPPAFTLPVCQEKKLKATIEGKNAGGDIELEPTHIKPFWDSSQKQIANFKGPDGTIKAKQESTDPVLITASAGDNPNILPGTAELTTICHVCDLSLSVTEGLVTIGSFLPISVDAIDNDGTLYDVAEITWESSDMMTAYVIPLEGGLTFVVGNQPGSATITATYRDDCEEKTASAAIEVPVPDPGDFIVQARLGDCGWNAPYCEFPSPKSTVPVTVRAGFANGGSVDWQPGLNVVVYGYIPGETISLEVSPSSGVTDGSGEFIADVTPIEAIPYLAVYVYVFEEDGPHYDDIDVRAISREFCDGAVNAHGTPYGSSKNIYADRGRFIFEMSPKRFHAVASVTGYQYYNWSEYTEYIWIVSSYWDTLLIIPTDLSLLGREADKAIVNLSGTGYGQGSYMGTRVNADSLVVHYCGLNNDNLSWPIASSNTWYASDAYGNPSPTNGVDVDTPESIDLNAANGYLIGRPWPINFFGKLVAGVSFSYYNLASGSAFAELSNSWKNINDILLDTGESIGPFKCISCSGENY